MKGASVARCAATMFLLLAAGCGDPRPDPVLLQPEIVTSTQRYRAEYVLAPGDQIEVSVFGVPEATRTAIVRSDGYISLPMIKEVKAAGLTVSELNRQLTSRFKERLVNPDVSITISNPREASVYVVGEVSKPGPVPIRSAVNVAEAIAGNGGVLHTADLDNVAVIRLNDDGYVTGYILQRQNTGVPAFYASLHAMLLRPGDIVVVPESGRSQFVRFIQDYVNTPLSGVNSILNSYLQFRLYQTL